MNDGTATHDQPTPGLLRLPVEIRQQIYKEALSGGTYLYPFRSPLPIEEPLSSVAARTSSSIKATRSSLTASSPSSVLSQTRQHALANDARLQKDGADDDEARRGKGRGPLSLLLTNRKIYTEALPTLYSFNTFTLHASPAALASLGQNTPPLQRRHSHYSGDMRTRKPVIPLAPTASTALTHLSRIRALHFSTLALQQTASLLSATPIMLLAKISKLSLGCCGRPGPDSRAHIPHGNAWRAIWAVVTRMSGLRDVEVRVCGAGVPMGWQRAVLGPMGDVSIEGLERERFKVFVPWGEESVLLHKEGGWPFIIERYGVD